MAIRKILAPLTGFDADRSLLATAFAVAQEHAAQVDGVFLRFDQRYEPLKVPEQLPAGLFDEVADIIAHGDAEEAKALRSFEAASAGASGAAARWLGTRPAERIIRDAPLADLVVLGQSARDQSNLAALRAAVLTTSGRPLMLAPFARPAAFGGVVAIAWNGGARSARAVASALPFLTGASAVHVLTARTAKTRSSEGARLVEYLACHGIKADCSVLSPAGEPVGSALLQKAGELDARLLVMGGQGRMRLRNMLFGGVTQYVFERAALPVLMAQ